MQIFPLKIYTGEEVQFIYTQAEFDAFASNYTKMKAAGGIVRNGKQELLMIYRRGKWDFPKGKVEENEKVHIAAIREVGEETGVENVSITEELPSTFHTYIENGISILKQTHWYEMVAKETIEPIPQTEEDITEVKWVPILQVADMLKDSYSSLSDLWNMLSF